MKKLIPVETSFAEWKKDPNYLAEYAVLEEEFALASALIEARGNAAMTQEQVAAAMGTTQAVVARLESGKVRPSTRTLNGSPRQRIRACGSGLSRSPKPRCKHPGGWSP